LDEAFALADQVDDPDVKAWPLFGRAMTLYTRGHFREALEWAERTERWVAQNCIDSGWLLAEVEGLIGVQHVAMGEIAKFRIASESTARRLKASGNEFQLAISSALRSQLTVARDAPDVALDELAEILREWPRNAVALITVWSTVNTLMYQGRSSDAWQLMAQHWPKFTRFGYQRVNPWRYALPLLEATVALACARDGLGASYLRVAEKGLERLRGLRMDWTGPSSQMLEAGLCQLKGDRETAAQLYGAAAEGYERLAMRGYVQMCRLRQSELLVGPEAEQLRASAERWFADQGIRKPNAWTRMFAPISALADAG
ncbi:MAG TPA: hypothetical protein VK524_21905, partial [Polyangiaceae bacterium]|nr:hypothetical protein [Polyangiaceae bacterium]